MATLQTRICDVQAPLEARPLAEDIDHALLGQQVEFYDQMTANPAYWGDEADLELARGSARLELGIHPDTSAADAQTLLEEAECHFDNVYDGTKATQAAILTSGLLLSALPDLEARPDSEATDDALADYRTDLLDLGDEMADMMDENYVAHFNSRTIFPGLMIRSGLVYYPARTGQKSNGR